MSLLADLAHRQMRMDTGLAFELGEHRTKVIRETAAVSPGAAEGEDGFADFVGCGYRQLSQLAEFLGHTRARAKGPPISSVQPDSDREDLLFDLIVQRAGDALTLAAKQLQSLGLGETLVELAELCDHLALAVHRGGRCRPPPPPEPRKSQRSRSSSDP